MDKGTAFLTFHADWRVEQSAPLVADSDVGIRYDRRRLLIGSDLVPAQQHSFGVSGFYRIDGGTATAFSLGGRPESAGDTFCEHVLHLPKPASQLELWFQRSGLYGNVRYDSDFGRNYTFTVFPTMDLTPAIRAYVGEVTRQAARRPQ